MVSTNQLLEQIGGAENLLEGAKQAYKFLALRFADPLCPIPKKLLCPTLHRVLDRVTADYKRSEVQAKVHFNESDLQAELVGIWTEIGEGDYYDDESTPSFQKFFEQWLNPDGDQSRRVVAAVRFKSLEMFKVVAPPPLKDDKWLSEIGQSCKRIRTHYWVFESILGDEDDHELEWRVRCINMAVIPEEGLKILS